MMTTHEQKFAGVAFALPDAAQIGRSFTLWPISCSSAISGRLAASVFSSCSSVWTE
jgi:hypothetical protein